MASLAGRVSAAASAFFISHSTRTTAAITVNQNWSEKARTEKTWTVSMAQSTPPTSTPAWTSGSERDFVSHVGAAAQFCNPLRSFRFRLRRSSRDPGVLLMASRGDGACNDAATAAVEGEPPPAAAAATIQDYKGRRASVAAQSSLFTWSVVSVISAIAFGGVHWLDGICTKGHKHVNRLEKQSEPVRYWTSISCLVVLWLSVAFFLLSHVQRWEIFTMMDGAFAPGDNFCHSLWPNTGLGCQLPFTTTQ